MCNYPYIDKLLTAPLLSARRFTVTLPALVIFVASCFPLSAQVPATGPGYRLHADEFDAMFDRDRFQQGLAADFDSAFPARRAAPPAPEPKVSVEELRHPLSEKARRLLVKAYDYAKKGEHSRAIATVREGMAKVSGVIPYAHALLGVEYLRVGRSAEAVPELTEAVHLFPHDAMAHSNFAVALCVIGQFEHAKQEARLALYLEPTLDNAQELLRMLAEDEARQSHR